MAPTKPGCRFNMRKVLQRSAAQMIGAADGVAIESVDMLVWLSPLDFSRTFLLMSERAIIAGELTKIFEAYLPPKAGVV